MREDAVERICAEYADLRAACPPPGLFGSQELV